VPVVEVTWLIELNDAALDVLLPAASVCVAVVRLPFAS
jgi:hypothetical protein